MKKNAPFPAAIVAAAISAQNATGLPALVSLVQWADESDYGRKMPAGSNNPFGMKVPDALIGKVAGVSHVTHEFECGYEITITAVFRKFGSIEQAFAFHAQRLTDPHGPYSSCLRYLHDPKAFIEHMAPIYATNPNYGHDLLHIANEFDLWHIP